MPQASARLSGVSASPTVAGGVAPAPAPASPTILSPGKTAVTLTTESYLVLPQHCCAIRNFYIHKCKRNYNKSVKGIVFP